MRLAGIRIRDTFHTFAYFNWFFFHFCFFCLATQSHRIWRQIYTFLKYKCFTYIHITYSILHIVYVHMYVCINYILTVVHASVGIVWQTFALFGICILFECNIIFCCWKLHTCAHFYTPHHPRHRRHHPRRASLLLLFLLWLFLPLQPHIEHITSTWDMWMHPLWFLCVSKWRRRW